MPRHQIKRRTLNPDPTYNDVAVEALVNQVMHDGKKTTARKVVYGAFDIVKERSNQDAVEVFQKAIENIAPLLEVKSKRVGGATYQVPREVPAHRRTSLALRWILQAARSKSGRPMKERLADEILAAAKGEGDAFKKREDTHRMAEANRAFAHFGW